MKSPIIGLLMAGALAACNDNILFVDDPGVIGGEVPAAPRAVAVTYYGGSVQVTWELAPDWNGEAFRVYSRRVSDTNWFFIAEVTSCAGDVCLYEDLNVVEDVTYEYLVSAVNDAGVETDAIAVVSVYVPIFSPPAVPDLPVVVALDNANYLTWGAASRGASDFSHYKVYLDDGGESLLLGETDSEGFLDLLAANGVTYGYFVTAVDADGHESGGSAIMEGTPRPDFTGEWVYDFADVPTSSGFRFSEDESVLPIVDGTDPGRHFRLETDANGWWLVPGPDAEIYPTGFQTTALKCGVGADAGCTDLTSAPLSGYATQDVQVSTQESYVFRVVGDDQLIHYGVIRIDLLGFDQNDDALMIFDWAYQLQPGNPNLVPGVGG
ncbi:MAG: fibronectin type III domain-containing protein [Longimicrobiales bacterium]